LILCAAVDRPQFKRSAALSDLARVRETIGKVRGHLEQRHVRTEADVRQYILNPVLPSLGWDAADPGTVRREYTVSSGQSHFQFDYALFDRAGKVVFVIEAKALGKLDDRARNQLLLYAMSTRTHLGLTTDGRTWDFYVPLEGGTSAQRLVRSVDLLVTEVEEAAGVLDRYLARNRVLSGKAHRAAADDRARLSLQRVVEAGWSDLLSGPSDEIVKTVASAARRAGKKEGLPLPNARSLNVVVRSFVGRGFSFGEPAAPAADLAPPAGSPSERVVEAGGNPKAPSAPKGTAVWTFQGERHVETNPTDLYVAAIGRLYVFVGDEGFYRQLREKIRGRKRAQIAESPEGTGAPKYVRPLPGGWHLNTNLSTRDKLRNLERACEVAGIAFGSDLVVENDGERVTGRGS